MPVKYVPIRKNYHYENENIVLDGEMLETTPIRYLRNLCDKNGNSINVAQIDEDSTFRNSPTSPLGRIILNRPFWAKLRIDGQYDKQFQLADVENNIIYYMFPGDFVNMVKTNDVIKGYVESEFSFISKTGKFGIKCNNV